MFCDVDAILLAIKEVKDPPNDAIVVVGFIVLVSRSFRCLKTFCKLSDI